MIMATKQLKDYKLTDTITIDIDDNLSDVSENPVQNKIITNELKLKSNNDDVNKALHLRVLKTNSQISFDTDETVEGIKPPRLNYMLKGMYNGQQVLVASGDGDGIYYAVKTADGKWEWQRSNVTEGEYRAGYIDDNIIILSQYDGDSKILTSKDGGRNWIIGKDIEGNPISDKIKRRVYGGIYKCGKYYVIHGDRYGGSDPIPQLCTFLLSEDGETWTPYCDYSEQNSLRLFSNMIKLDDNNLLGVGNYQSIYTFYPVRYTFNEDGTITSSTKDPNENSYNPIPGYVNGYMQVSRCYDIKDSYYDNKKIIVLGTMFGVYVSFDEGVTFQNVFSISTVIGERGDIREIAYHDGTFYFFGYLGEVFSTTDFERFSIITKFAKQITSAFPPDEYDSVWVMAHKVFNDTGFSTATSSQVEDILLSGRVMELEKLEQTASTQEIIAHYNQLINILQKK